MISSKQTLHDAYIFFQTSTTVQATLVKTWAPVWTVSMISPVSVARAGKALSATSVS